MSDNKDIPAIDPSVPPSGTGCVECLATPGGWWVHLRRCAACGHIGCCDSSPSQHATAHFKKTGHPVMASFEPGEDWFYDFTTQRWRRTRTRPANQSPGGPGGAGARGPGAGQLDVVDPPLRRR
ncbi:UBP-type zinc finger domain-containing protein [Enemella evansiae]|uniref:UBP-type zinc finger domain-containing protein n=1 Tax=Enemella evansiae TaxID=2016499 RepID=UPI001E462DE9|nr:UBP-type zinc finger domain-containing protein [Enemella evansiae]